MTAKFKAGESAGTYIADAPVTEADIVEMWTGQPFVDIRLP